MKFTTHSKQQKYPGNVKIGSVLYRKGVFDSLIYRVIMSLIITGTFPTTPFHVPTLFNFAINVEPSSMTRQN